MGGRNSIFNDPTDRHRGASTPGVKNMLRRQEEKRIMDAATSADQQFEAALEDGSLSDETFTELRGKLRNPDGITQADVDALMSIFSGEKEGTSAKGRSRLATQKLFETVMDQPGRRQTLLTPKMMGK